MTNRGVLRVTLPSLIARTTTSPVFTPIRTWSGACPCMRPRTSRAAGSWARPAARTLADIALNNGTIHLLGSHVIAALGTQPQLP
jgi:hypothetical protein